MMELPYKVNGNPVFVDDEVYPVGYRASTDKFKYKGNNVAGLYYGIGTNKGQKRAFGDNYYYTTNNQKTLISIAQEGTCVMGGEPNYLIETPGEHHLSLSGGKLILDNSIILHQYSANVPYIKLYGAACGGGGGGANNEGSGGSAGGAAFFPMILFPKDIITIYVGKGGDPAGDDETHTNYAGGQSGEQTLLLFGKLGDYETVDMTRVFVECGSGDGGLLGDRENHNTPQPGYARTFFARTSSVHESYQKWINILSADVASLYTDTRLSSVPNKTTFCMSFTGGRGGDGNKNGHSSYESLQNNSGFGSGVSSIRTQHSDCLRMFTDNYYSTSGGAGLRGGATVLGALYYTSGGGASAFYKSKGGDGGGPGDFANEGDVSTQLRGKDGLYGGGGGSGGYNQKNTVIVPGAGDYKAYAGGRGGNGCVALWYGGKEGNITIDTSGG